MNKNMRLLTTSSILIAVAMASHAETTLPPPSQELLPLASGITYHSPEYYAKIRAVLFRGPDIEDPFASCAPWEDEFQFLKLPPFTPETLLTVSRKGTNYVAVVRQPKKQIWTFGGDTADLAVDQKEKLLPAPLAQRADRLWREMLIRARFAESGVYPDAVSYCFFKWIKGAGTLAGETHPRNNTKPSILVGVALNIVQFINADAKDEEGLLANIDSLMRKLEEKLDGEGESSNKTPGHVPPKAAADGGL